MEAKQLDDNKVKMGQMIRVANQLKQPTANEKYIALHVEDEDGKNERCLLFTEVEIADVENVVFDGIISNMKFGRLYKAKISKKETNLVRVKNT